MRSIPTSRLPSMVSRAQLPLFMRSPKTGNNCWPIGASSLGSSGSPEPAGTARSGAGPLPLVTGAGNHGPFGHKNLTYPARAVVLRPQPVRRNRALPSARARPAERAPINQIQSLFVVSCGD